jgi:hypothetical protein
MLRLPNQFICTLVLLLALAGSASAYSGGSGTTGDPYQISDVNDWQQLMSTSTDWSKSFVLIADVNLADVTVTPVGNATTPFIGVFDGDGHVISNATINTPASSCVGLFGYFRPPTGSVSQIRNLGLISVNMTGYGFVGGLIGENNGTVVSDCYVTGTVTSTLTSDDSYAGGLTGRNTGLITDCHATVTVFGRNIVGGLIGNNLAGTVIDCYATGTVTGRNSVGGLIGHKDGNRVIDSYATGAVSGKYYVGGFIGQNDSPNTVSGCYATGTVSGEARVGGFIGQNSASTSTVSDCYATGAVTSTATSNSYAGGLIGYIIYGTITNCYSTGTASGTSKTGGLTGYNSGTVSNCFWDTDASGLLNGAGGGSSTGIYGQTTIQMKQQATFTAYTWDFLGDSGGTADTWRMCVDGVDYPHLTWEYVNAGDFACPDGVAFDDFARLAADWLMTYSAPLYGADATGDSTVNFADFAVLAANWMQ